MKKLLFILLCLPMIGFGQGQVDCSRLTATDFIINNSSLTIDIAIYNGDTMDTHYPFIAYTIDALGDTIQNGNINWFVTPGLDTSWYYYTMLSPIIPAYPLRLYFVYSNLTGSNPGEDTCIISYHSSCGAVSVSFNQIDTIPIPYLIHFDVQTLGFGGGNFGYGGFVLLDNNGDTVAYENINTAANVFGLMQYSTENRVLDVMQNFTLPFSGTLHLIHGWFAGNGITACIFPFNINNGTTDINEIINTRRLLKVTDILGRQSKETQNTLLFYIYNDGTVEKKIIIK